MAKVELIKKVVIDRLGIRIEWYVTEKGTVYYMVRNVRTGRFMKKPKFLVVKFLKSGEYPEHVKGRKGRHPFFMEIAVTKSYDFDEFVDDLLENDLDEIVDMYYAGISDDILTYEISILQNELNWDDRAYDMVNSENWINKLVGYEIDTSDVEEEEVKLLEWHR